jgi:hypothetical protein
MLADGGQTSIIGAVPGNDQAEMSCAVSFKIIENLQGFRFAHVLRVVLGRRKGQKAAKRTKRSFLLFLQLFASLKKNACRLPVFKHRYKREEVNSCSN